MKKAKKIVAVALAAASMSLAFAGCGGSAESSKADNSGTDGKVYNITGVLADKGSGREYLTLPCAELPHDAI